MHVWKITGRYNLESLLSISFVSLLPSPFSSSFSSSSPSPPSTVTQSVEEFRKLRCSIGNNTNYLIEGLKDAMTEEITKRSPKLGRDAVYLRKSHISKLPQYMVVQFVRFFWRTDNGEKTKIVRRVQFPMRLDTLDVR